MQCISTWMLTRNHFLREICTIKHQWSGVRFRNRTTVSVELALVNNWPMSETVIGYSRRRFDNFIVFVSKMAESLEEVEEERKQVSMLKRKVQKLIGEAQDTRLHLESQQSRNAELEKKQRK